MSPVVRAKAEAAALAEGLHLSRYLEKLVLGARPPMRSKSRKFGCPKCNASLRLVPDDSP